MIAVAPCSTVADYVESVRLAGGEPRVLDRARDRPADVIRGAAGLLLAGGGDVRPAIYGEAPHPAFDAAEDGRDEYELELLRRALDADLPVFAICRGIQVLAVAHGGTLVQHIPTDVGTTIDHMVREPRFARAHDIAIASGSLLERLMHARGVDGGLDAAACSVNSRHHQAPRTAGDGLVVTAIAPDSIIEAIEDPTRRFCLGVQWHPENYWQTGEFQGLFRGFVEACTI